MQAATAPLDEGIKEALAREIEQALQIDDAKVQERERASRRIIMVLQGISRNWKRAGNNKSPSVAAFGSFSNGFKAGSSDLDVVLLGEPPDISHSLLQRFANETPQYGFENVTKIFTASVPLLKLTDIKSQIEVDFCINNELGVRNSLLLYTYCEYDSRLLQVGRLVKDWAKRHELVGTADGYLNSYAYMLLVVHYLQSVDVVPNLQALATESVKIADSKWGGEDYWETKFVTDVQSLPPSKNTQSAAELLVGFFWYFVNFDWGSYAVCPRLNSPGHFVDKKSLTLAANSETWYVEDPFDLKHNLAGKCTPAGRKRILECMSESLTALSVQPVQWQKAFPPPQSEVYYLKCRISPNIKAEDLLEEFEGFDLLRLHFPKSDGSRMAQAFLEFGSAMARRKAHTKNEQYVQDCHLQLHYSSDYSLREAVKSGVYSTYNVASYRMQREFIRASASAAPVMMPRPDLLMRQGPPFQDAAMSRPPMMPMGGYPFYQQRPAMGQVQAAIGPQIARLPAAVSAAAGGGVSGWDAGAKAAAADTQARMWPPDYAQKPAISRLEEPAKVLLPTTFVNGIAAQPPERGIATPATAVLTMPQRPTSKVTEGSVASTTASEDEGTLAAQVTLVGAEKKDLSQILAHFRHLLPQAPTPPRPGPKGQNQINIKAQGVFTGGVRELTEHMAKLDDLRSGCTPDPAGGCLGALSMPSRPGSPCQPPDGDN